MARRPRQTAKGTTVENGMGAARITPLCLFRIRENGQKPFRNLDLQYRRSAIPGVGSTTRIRTRGFSPRVFFARWRKNARIRSDCARKIAKTDGTNPSVASLDIYGSAMSPSGNTSPRLFGPVVSPCGSTRSRERDASPDPGFLASDPPHSLAETRMKPLSLHPKKSPTTTVPTRR